MTPLSHQATAAAARKDIADQVRVPAHVNIEAICGEYAPYTGIKEFNVGFTDYLNGLLFNTAHRGGVEQQAYDRGYEAGMRVMRFTRWVDENVGSN